MKFFVGLHQPSDAQHFESAFISVNRLWRRRSPFRVNDWILDSGAFTEINRHGDYRNGVETYAREIERWRVNGNLMAAVAQDYMCESFILRRTGLSVHQHQTLTIARYDALLACVRGSTRIMPVLQGYAPDEYVEHLQMYGGRLRPGSWVGVGSVCKRNRDPAAVEFVLSTIKAQRPDLRLHGFGLKATALSYAPVRRLLQSADSMAWSFSARKQRRNPNDWREAKRWAVRIEGMAEQHVNDTGSLGHTTGSLETEYCEAGR